MLTYRKLAIAIMAIAGITVSASGQAGQYAAPAVAARSAYAASSTSASPDTANGTDDPILTIKKRVDEVNVLFIATDRHGKFVRNLDQSDFSILDDHKPVQSIVNFRRETDLPIELGLLVDVSASVRSRFDFEKEAATGFLQHILRAGYDKAFVVGFNKNSQITQDFTDNAHLLAAAPMRQ